MANSQLIIDVDIVYFMDSHRNITPTSHHVHCSPTACAKIGSPRNICPTWRNSTAVSRTTSRVARLSQFFLLIVSLLLPHQTHTRLTLLFRPAKHRTLSHMSVRYQTWGEGGESHQCIPRILLSENVSWLFLLTLISAMYSVCVLDHIIIN